MLPCEQIHGGASQITGEKKRYDTMRLIVTVCKLMYSKQTDPVSTLQSLIENSETLSTYSMTFLSPKNRNL